MARLKSLLFACSMLCLPGMAMAQAYGVGADEYPLGAVLPSSRVASVGTPITVWASLYNTSANAADCHINQWSADDAPFLSSFHYQAYSSDGTSAEAAQDTPVSVPGGGSQNFLLSFVTSQSFTARDFELGFGCSQTSGNADMVWGPVMTGTNTLRLISVSGATPDIISVADTTSGDGVVHVGIGGNMAVAALNIGDPAGSENVYVVPDFGPDQLLPYVQIVCETNPADGTCLPGSGSSFITADMSAGVKTFSVYVSPNPASPAGSMLYPDIGKLRLGFYFKPASDDAPETAASAPMTAIPSNAGTEYGSTALAISAFGPGPDFVGPVGPYESALLQSNGGWWYGKAVGAWQAPYDSMIAGKYSWPGADWSYFVFVRPGVAKDGDGKVLPDFGNGTGDMHTFVVYNDGAFPAERRSVKVSGTFEHRRGFNMMMAETAYETLAQPVVAGIKGDTEHLSGPVNVRGTQHLEFEHDLTGTALSDYFYHLNGDPYTGISISPSLQVSGSFTDHLGGRCYINEGSIAPNTNGYNSFMLSFVVSDGCAVSSGTYEGPGVRMYSASGSWEPYSLWALVYRTMDLSHSATNDSPVELILAADPPR